MEEKNAICWIHFLFPVAELWDISQGDAQSQQTDQVPVTGQKNQECPLKKIGNLRE
jgi:hypothetical protein